MTPPDEWKPTKPEAPEYKCRCGSDDVWYRHFESSCGGFDDIRYECRACNHHWWSESADA